MEPKVAAGVVQVETLVTLMNEGLRHPDAIRISMAVRDLVEQELEELKGAVA